MAVGARGIHRIDAVHPSFEDGGTFVYVFRLALSGRLTRAVTRKFAPPQDALQAAAREWPGRGSSGRPGSCGCVSFIISQPLFLRFGGLRGDAQPCGCLAQRLIDRLLHVQDRITFAMFCEPFQA